MTNDKAQRDAMHEELSAYLDGELDADTVRCVEQRLASDASYRTELQKLERAWLLLSDLPRAQVGDAFTCSTLEMAAVATQQEPSEDGGERPARNRWRPALAVCALALLSLAGFVTGRLAWPNPNERLLAELPVLENFELFDQIDQIDWLRLLQRANLFGEGESPPMLGKLTSDERQAHVADLSAAQQQELLRRQARFEALPTAERARLRGLEMQLEADADAESLARVLANYHDWLKSLAANQRARLAELSASDRVDQVKRILNQQQVARRQEEVTLALTPADLRAIRQWRDEVVWLHRAAIIAEMPPPRREKYGEVRGRGQQQRQLVTFAMNRGLRGGSGGVLMFIDAQDFERLANQLSLPPRAQLEGLPNLQMKRQLASRWIALAADPAEQPAGARRAATLSAAELADFIEHEISPEERTRLAKLTPEKMREEAQSLYLRQPPRFEPLPPDRGGPRGGMGPPRAGGARRGQRPDSPAKNARGSNP